MVSEKEGFASGVVSVDASSVDVVSLDASSSDVSSPDASSSGDCFWGMERMKWRKRFQDWKCWAMRVAFAFAIEGIPRAVMKVARVSC